MKKQAEYYLNLEEIENFDLAAIEEKLLYFRYLIRREQKEFKLIKFQFILERLERRREYLSATSGNAAPASPGS
ncbi:MAG: hypothetical protein ACO1NZ_03230 [Adhaeribacter sp.]